MIKTLKKHGNSMALVIEKPILELLGANADTEFHVGTDGKSLIITPIQPLSVAEASKIINAKYHNVFRELAK